MNRTSSWEPAHLLRLRRITRQLLVTTCLLILVSFLALTLVKNINTSSQGAARTSAAAAIQQLKGPGGSLSAKTATAMSPQGQTSSMEITLNLVEPDTIITADAALAEYNNLFCACVNLEDAVKFTNTNETFGLVRNGASLAIERRPIIVKADTLFLRLLKSTQRNYQVVFNAINLAQPQLVAFLEDSYTGTSSPVNMDGVTAINFNVNATPASLNKDRFRVIFKELNPLAVYFTMVDARQEDTGILVSWQTTNDANQARFEIERSADGIHFTKAGALVAQPGPGTTPSYSWADQKPLAGENIYRVVKIDKDGSLLYSKMVKARLLIGPQPISIYPNPVTEGVVNLDFHHKPAGTYSVRLIGDQGQLLMIKSLAHSSGAKHTILLPKILPNGVYTLEIVDASKGRTSLPLVVR
jgi:hypothetical protein